MNREIKFRAWDSHHKVMINPYCELRDGHFWGEDCTNTGISVAHENVMQFTGLKDKNGKEIYEGDILKFELPVNGADGEEAFLPLIVTISFQGAAFWFTGGGYTDCNWHFYNEENREVIGNIYENPELLKP